MKKILLIVFIFLFSSSVHALSLKEIKEELLDTSTYQMYTNMGDTSISITKDTLAIKYPTLNPDNNKSIVVKYILEDNILMTSFTGNINNRFDILDNPDTWTLELIDIIALSNGNTSEEIKSITKSYLKDAKFSDDNIEVSYEDYDIINLNGEEEKSSLFKSFKISLDYKIKEDKLDKEVSSIELVKLSKSKVTLKLTSTLDNATCTLYYKDSLDDILYMKVSEANCGKKDKDTKITIDIKDNTKTYYFLSYIDNHPLESNILEIKPYSKDYKLPIVLGSITVLNIIIILSKIKTYKRKDL